jgi:hypothetical protein
VLIRAASYGLPIELDSHVDYVFNIVHFPVQNKIGTTVSNRHRHRKWRSDSLTNELIDCPTTSSRQYSGCVTLQLISFYYEIDNNMGNMQTSQAFYMKQLDNQLVHQI